MKTRMNNMIAAVRDWRLLAGYSKRKIIGKLGEKPVSVVEYKINVPESLGLCGKKMLFFSDLHYGSINLNVDSFYETLSGIDPAWIVFGGDLITYACHQEKAFGFLRELFEPFPKAAKIAVFGNWDRRRNRWYPASKWVDAYSEIGFNLLINERIELGGINFYGMDEPRIGNPEFNYDAINSEQLNCVVSHSVDPVVDAMPENNAQGKQLFLCGHSHGGQVRVPFFGALLTSTKYWKLFEYGHYYSKRQDIDLILTAGVGTTRLPFRLFCQPEIVLITFNNQTSL